MKVRRNKMKLKRPSEWSTDERVSVLILYGFQQYSCNIRTLQMSSTHCYTLSVEIFVLSSKPCNQQATTLFSQIRRLYSCLENFMQFYCPLEMYKSNLNLTQTTESGYHSLVVGARFSPILSTQAPFSWILPPKSNMPNIYNIFSFGINEMIFQLAFIPAHSLTQTYIHLPLHTSTQFLTH